MQLFLRLKDLPRSFVVRFAFHDGGVVNPEGTSFEPHARRRDDLTVNNGVPLCKVSPTTKNPQQFIFQSLFSHYSWITILFLSLVDLVLCPLVATTRNRNMKVVANTLLVLVVVARTTTTTTEAFVVPHRRHDPSSTTALRSTGGFRPSSKQQDKVAIDPKTGLYRPIKREKAQKKSLVDGEALASSWDAAKEAVYSSVDGLKALNKKTAEVIAKSPLNKNKKRSGDADLDDGVDEYRRNLSAGGVVGGYADIERELGATAANLPKVPLVKKPSDQKPKEQPTSPVDKILATKTKALKNKQAAEQPLIPPTGLEKAKNAIWSGIDAVQVQPKTKNKAEAINKLKNPSTSVALTMENAMESFQPAVRARMIASDDFLNALADLDSPNPVTRLQAGRRIKALAQQEQAAMQQEAGPNPLATAKQTFYQAVDAAQATKTSLEELPRRVQETYKSTVETTNKAVQVAQEVPSRVQQSINETIDNTQKTVKEVSELPGRVQKSVQGTNADLQRRVKETQETAQRVSKTVSDITTQSKVWLGLEKPKPRPPNTPPPEPLKASDVAWKLLTVSGSLAAEAGWFVGKNGAKLAWKASSLAATKGGEVVQAKMKEYQAEQKEKAAKAKDFNQLQKDQAEKIKAYQEKMQKQAEKNKPRESASATDETATTAAIPKPPASPKSIAMADLEAKQEKQDKDMSALEQEIEEALRMADMAIQSAQDEIAQEKQGKADLEEENKTGRSEEDC